MTPVFCKIQQSCNCPCFLTHELHLAEVSISWVAFAWYSEREYHCSGSVDEMLNSVNDGHVSVTWKRKLSLCCLCFQQYNRAEMNSIHCTPLAKEEIHVKYQKLIFFSETMIPGNLAYDAFHETHMMQESKKHTKLQSSFLCNCT